MKGVITIIQAFINFFSSNFIVSLGTFLGFLSFGASAFAAIKAFKIDRKLIKYQQSEQFNQNKEALILRIQGFIEVINDNDFQKSLIPDVIANLSNIRNGYKDILPLSAKYKLWILLHHLKKSPSKINQQTISNNLAYLKGILENGDCDYE